MKIIVMGSAAGGGFPQWNCNCRNCAGVRSGAVRARMRTQSSIAVSMNGRDWVLVNVSPDILAQLRATPALQPAPRTATPARDSRIAAVMLVDAQIDHVAGLLMLREGRPLPLYCTAAVWHELNDALTLAPVLSHYCGLHWHALDLGDADGVAPPTVIPGIEGLRFTPVPLVGKAPPYSPHRQQPAPGDNIGLLIEDGASGRTVFYAPGLGAIDGRAAAALNGADCVLVDGTFWRGDELTALGFSRQSAADMGHLPQSGADGMIAALERIQARRKILIHINNTNPILDEDSAQRALLARHGIEVAFDGMEIEP